MTRKALRWIRQHLSLSISILILVVAVTLAPVIALPGSSDEDLPILQPPDLAPTLWWRDFYGLDSTYLGQPLSIGAIVQAYDPNGTLCGEFEVKTKGWYGVMPVYGDDPRTEIDEGAINGDIIVFMVDGVLATTDVEPIWSDKVLLNRVELSVNYASLSKEDVNAVYVEKHDDLSRAYYGQKDSGSITKAEEALFLKAHTYLGMWHERVLIEKGFIDDRFVDFTFDLDGNIDGLKSEKTRFDELTDKLVSRKLTDTETDEVRDKWDVDIDDVAASIEASLLEVP